MRKALIVMAKEPVAGRTKTRLCPPLTPPQAAALSGAFLRDVVEIVRTVPQLIDGVEPIIAHAPGDDPRFFAGLAPDLKLIEQQGATLSERLNHVLTSCLHAGSDQVVAINSDSPTLPAAYIAAAFSQLACPKTDAVFGPCEDGGYYLIGVMAPHPKLVLDVQMSTPSVLRDTLTLAGEEGLRTALTPGWYDVDTADELSKLQRELTGSSPNLARHTRSFLAAHCATAAALQAK